MKITTKNIKTTAFSTMATILGLMSPVLADGGGEIGGDIADKIENAKSLLYMVMGLVGGLIVAFSMISIFQGHKNGDDNKTDKGITGVIIGILMSSFASVMAFLGF